MYILNQYCESFSYYHILYIGIKDPLREDVVESVTICREAGIFVRMVTGQNYDEPYMI